MNSIKNIFNIEKKSLNYLGKWKIEYKNKIINKKIDLANIDHCGCCEIENIKKEIKNINDEDEYIKYFLII